MAKPVIAYPGAKWRFYPYIKPFIPLDTKIFIEPFFGGGSMSLSVLDDPDFNIEKCYVGDLAPEIWAFWTGCRNNPEEVINIAKNWYRTSCPSHAKAIELGELESGETYDKAIEEAYKFWNWSQSVDCSVNFSIEERAARVFLVNKFSFSGMGDSGSLSKDRFMAFTEEQFNRIREAAPLLQKMEIANCSFEETMKHAYERPEETLIFLDPPYFKQEKSGLYGRNGDTHHGFPHEKFAELTQSMPCKWFVTYDDSIKVRKMFKDNYILPFTIPGGYTMAMKASEDALAGEELFIANYDITSSEDGDDDLLDMI